MSYELEGRIFTKLTIDEANELLDLSYSVIVDNSKGYQKEHPAWVEYQKSHSRKLRTAGDVLGTRIQPETEMNYFEELLMYSGEFAQSCSLSAALFFKLNNV